MLRFCERYTSVYYRSMDTRMQSPQGDARPTDQRAGTSPQPRETFFGDIVRFTIVAMLIVLPIRIFIAQPFIVAGASMSPTFENGQYLIVDQLTYRFDEPARGDVVIFRYPRDPSKFFIKRIVALPGETIRIEGSTVTIINAAHPDGFALEEAYVSSIKHEPEATHVLAEHEYFVLGDNRSASSDSRTWGTLSRDLIVGRALVRLLPVTEASILPGKHTPLELTSSR